MEEKAIRGVRWTLLSHASSRAATLATTLVLARLLVPGDFGLVAFAALLAAFTGHLAGFGIGPALVARPDIGRDRLGVGLSILLAGGIAGAGVLAALAPLLGSLIDAPRAAGVIAALALTVVVGGVGVFHASLLQRELLFRRLFAAQAAQVATLAAVSVPLAATGAGVWSLVAGQVAAALAYAATVLLLAPFRVAPALDRMTARTLWSSGRGFMLQGSVSFAEQNADYLIIGSALGAGPLGLYSMAYRTSELPYGAIVDPVSQVTFPGFARMRQRSEDVNAAFLATLRLVALSAFPLGALLSGAAEPFVGALLGSKWAGAVALLSILGLWGSMRTIEGAIGWFVISVGLSWQIGRAYVVVVAVSVPALLLAVSAGDTRAVAWVMVANIVALTATVATIARRRAGVAFRAQWRAVRTGVLASGPAWLASRVAADLGDDLAPAAALAVALLAGVGVYSAAVLLIDRAAPRDVAAQLARTFAR